MDSPALDLMDQDACYHKLVGLLHPDGVACPGCKADDHLHASTATPLAGTHRTPAQIMPILRGSAQAVPTARLARELGCDRTHPLELRRLMRGNAERWLGRNPLGDDVAGADEMYQKAGEEGVEHPDPDDPPRGRANNRRGHGRTAGGRGGRPRVGRGPAGGGGLGRGGRAG